MAQVDNELSAAGLRVVVGPVIGKVTESEARVLVELNNVEQLPVTVRLVSQSDEHEVVCEKEARAEKPTIFTFSGLHPETKYEVSIDNVENIPSSLKTLPEDQSITDVAKRIACVSCNKFRYTKEIEEKDKEQNLWRHLAKPEIYEKISVMLHMGDQIYADSDRNSGNSFNAFSKSLALLESKSHEEFSRYGDAIQNLYRDCYRETWGHEGQRAAMANMSNLMIPDDHDVADDWGELPEHSDPKSAEYFIANIALDVIHDYQRQLWEDLPEDGKYTGEHYCQVFGEVGMCFIDLHMGRCVYAEEGDELKYLSDSQWKDIRSWFSDTGAFKDCKSVLFVSPIPLVYVPTKTANRFHKLEDDVEGGWSYRDHEIEQGKMLDLLFEWKRNHPGREVTVLSGDVHIGAHTIIQPKAKEFKNETIMQFIASPISNDTLNKATMGVVKLCISTGANVEGRYEYTMHKFCTANNFGIVDICNKDGVLNVECHLGAMFGKKGLRYLTKIDNHYKMTGPVPSFRAFFSEEKVGFEFSPVKSVKSFFGRGKKNKKDKKKKEEVEAM